MKFYGFKRTDLKTCIFGCCGYYKNPNLKGAHSNVKPFIKASRHRARQASKALTRSWDD